MPDTNSSRRGREASTSPKIAAACDVVMVMRASRKCSVLTREDLWASANEPAYSKASLTSSLIGRSTEVGSFSPGTCQRTAASLTEMKVTGWATNCKVVGSTRRRPKRRCSESIILEPTKPASKRAQKIALLLAIEKRSNTSHSPSRDDFPTCRHNCKRRVPEKSHSRYVWSAALSQAKSENSRCGLRVCIRPCWGV
jgi:hypothetical protein